MRGLGMRGLGAGMVAAVIVHVAFAILAPATASAATAAAATAIAVVAIALATLALRAFRTVHLAFAERQIGRASCRERGAVCMGVDPVKTKNAGQSPEFIHKQLETFKP